MTEKSVDESERCVPGSLQEGESEPTALAAGDSVYTSAATFEELPLSPELLQVCDPLYPITQCSGCTPVLWATGYLSW